MISYSYIYLTKGIDLIKSKNFWTKIEDLKSIKLNALSAYDDIYIKIKIRTYGDRIYTNFRG